MRKLKLALLLLSVVPSFRRLSAQSDVTPLAIRFSAWTAVTGFERPVTDSLLALLPGAARDRFGNVIVTLGRGTPQRLASCDIDEPGYVVGAVTDDGYLRLRRVPRSSGWACTCSRLSLSRSVHSATATFSPRRSRASGWGAPRSRPPCSPSPKCAAAWSSLSPCRVATPAPG